MRTVPSNLNILIIDSDEHATKLYEATLKEHNIYNLSNFDPNLYYDVVLMDEIYLHTKILQNINHGTVVLVCSGNTPRFCHKAKYTLHKPFLLKDLKEVIKKASIYHGVRSLLNNVKLDNDILIKVDNVSEKLRALCAS